MTTESLLPSCLTVATNQQISNKVAGREALAKIWRLCRVALIFASLHEVANMKTRVSGAGGLIMSKDAFNHVFK